MLGFWYSTIFLITLLIQVFAECDYCTNVLVLNVLTDFFPSESSYSLSSSSDDSPCFISLSGPNSTWARESSYVITLSEALCSGETYVFTFYDSYEDGMGGINGSPPGSYSVELNGEVMATVEGASFGSYKETIISLPDVPSLAPTITPAPTVAHSPTSIPTPLPFSTPTTTTQYPTHLPTSTDCSHCTTTLVLNVLTDFYSDESSYTLRHVLTGTTIDDSACFGDLDGPDSIWDATTSYTITLSETLCAGETYVFTFYDAYGDGMSGYDGPPGEYSLVLNGEVLVIVDGTAFTFWKATTIKVPGIPSLAPTMTTAPTVSLGPTSTPTPKPTSTPILLPTSSPTVIPTPNPSPSPTSSPHPTTPPTLLPTPLPTSSPSFSPSLLPSKVPSIPTAMPSVTMIPTLSPTSLEAVTLSVAFSLTASASPAQSDKDNLKTLVLNQLQLTSSSQMKNFDVVSAETSRRARHLLAANVSWDVSFDIVLNSFSDTGEVSMQAYQSTVEALLSETSFHTNITTSVPSVISFDSVSSVILTRNPSSVPTFVPSPVPTVDRCHVYTELQLSTAISLLCENIVLRANIELTDVVYLTSIFSTISFHGDQFEIMGTGATTLFDIDSCTSISFHNMSFYGGYGAITISQSTVAIQDCKIYNNTISSLSDDVSSFDSMYAYGEDDSFRQAGGITAVTSVLTITNSDVYDNYVVSEGGGLYVQDSTVSIINSTIRHNNATKNGGGMYAIKSTVTIRRSTWAGNKGLDGGAILALRCNLLHISSSEFYDNRANDDTVGVGSSSIDPYSVGDGGAIAAYQVQTLLVIDSSIHDNFAQGTGGGMMVYDGNSISYDDNGYYYDDYDDDEYFSFISNSSIHNNIAATGGGGIDSSFVDEIVVIDSTIHGNIVLGGNFYGSIYGYSGGGIQSKSQYLTIINTDIYNNSAFKNKNNLEGSGGGIVIEKVDLYIDQSSIHHNSAELNGGGVSSCCDSIVAIASTMVYDNVATGSGGGLYLPETETTLTNMEVYNNTARLNAGGLFSSSSSQLSVEAVSFYNNEAKVDGGGIYISGSSTLELGNSSIVNNTAGNNGGGLYLDSSEADISNVDISYNTALGQGAGLSAVYATMTMHDIRVESNVAVGEGGGLSLLGSTVSISDCAISDNQVTSGNGGGISIKTLSEVELTKSVISTNHASGSGGGVSIAGSSTFIGCSVLQNTALYGGGVHVEDGSYLDIGSYIANNSVTSLTFTFSEVVGLGYPCNCTLLEGCFYSSNYPLDYGLLEGCVITTVGEGTLDVAGFKLYQNPTVPAVFDSLTIDGTVYQGTNSPDGLEVSNGDTMLWDVSSLSASDVGFKICSSVFASGGGIYIEGGLVKLNGTIVDENTALIYGGGIFATGGTTTMVDVVISNNNAETATDIFFEGGTMEAVNLILPQYSDLNSFSGDSIDAFICQSDCQLGQNGVCTATASSKCFVNCGCADCPAGKVYGSIGSTQLSDCESCGSGQYAAAGSFECSVCPQGSFAANNSQDMGGGLIVQVFSGAKSCNECPAGYYAPSTGTVVCQACPSGHISAAGASSCLACKVGTFASDSNTQCANCSAGSYNPTEASASCTSCDSGTFSVDGQSSCSDCPAGKSSGNAAGSCTNCESGKYADEGGATSCSLCDATTTSSAGATSCDQAIAGYYMFKDEAVECNSGTLCAGAYYLPYPKRGYWIDRAELKYFHSPYKCARQTCKGGSLLEQEEGSNNQSCWTEATLSLSTCQEDKVMCTVGARGPLCSSCEPNYRYSSSNLKCEECGSSGSVMSYVVTAALLSIMLVTMGLYSFKFLKLPPYLRKLASLISMFKHMMNNGSLTVLFSTYQIVQSITVSMELVYPTPFSDSLQMLNFLNFEVPGLECTGLGIQNRVYVVSSIPVGIALLILIVSKVRFIKAARHLKAIITQSATEENDGKDLFLAKQQLQQIKSQQAWSLLVLSYLVLPPVTSLQFKALDCYVFSNTDNSRYLRMDTSVDCDASSYQVFAAIDGVFIVAYLSIPIVWFVLLWRSKKALFPYGIFDESLIVKKRKLDKSLVSLRFLYERYRSDMVYWECLDMLRRILFVAIVPLMATTTLLRAAIGLGLSFVFVIIERELEPYSTEATNTLSVIACVVIYLTYAASLTIETGISNGLNQLLFGCILLFINCIVVVTALSMAYLKARQERQLLERKKEKQIQRMEWACGFSKNKFDTTFATINATVISSSHAAYCYYGTISDIKQVLRSGIVVQDNTYDGILFTMHQPHDMTEHEKNAFPSLEAFVVCSLPKNLMKKVHDKGAAASLFVLPKTILQGIRGFYFDELVDPSPWEQGKLLLPPQCIKRCYQWLEIEENHAQHGGGATTATNKKKLEEGKRMRSMTSFLKLTPNPLKRDSSGMVVDDIELTTQSSIKHTDFVIPYQVGLQQPPNVSSYLDQMDKYRKLAAEYGLVPLYHYTMPAIAPLILNGGFRMSTQGQGDGGVYFSTLGPSSYELGSEEYEDNIIIDCFGKERLEEYRSKHKLDVCLVYAIDPLMVEQAPGGRDNAVVVPKSYFEDLSLPHPDGSYFLRPDHIMGAFLLDPAEPPVGYHQCLERLEAEKRKDLDTQKSVLSRAGHHEDIIIPKEEDKCIVKPPKPVSISRVPSKNNNVLTHANFVKSPLSQQEKYFMEESVEKSEEETDTEENQSDLFSIFL